MKVLWAKPAAEAFRSLPALVQEDVAAHRIDLIREFPEMYPVRTRQPLRGFRYFFTRDWCVSYTIAENTIVILAVFSARRE